MKSFYFQSDAQIHRAYSADGDFSAIVRVGESMKRMLVTFDVFGNAVLTEVK